MDRGAWWATVHGVAKSQIHFGEQPILAFTLMFDAQFHSEGCVPGDNETGSLGAPSSLQTPPLLPVLPTPAQPLPS